LTGRADAQILTRSDTRDEGGGGMTTPVDPALKAPTTNGRAHGAVNFDELLEHYFGAYTLHRREGEKDVEIAKRHERFLEMLDAFEKDEGRVRSQTWCLRIESGALLTAKRPTSNLQRTLSGDQVRYFAGGNPVEVDEDLKLGELMAMADREAQRVQDLLRNPMRGNALKQLYDVRAMALEGFEAMAKRKNSGDAVDQVRSVTERQVAAQLKAAVEYAERAMRLRASILYLFGMASGVIGLMFVAGIMLFFFGRKTELIAGTDFMPTALVLGGLGAVISVLQRITSGHVTASLENGLTAVFLLGLFRPVIGAVMAVAITVLILGGILPLQVPEEAAKGVFFLAGISFLAGFSERYARTMIGAAETRATPTDETDADTETDADSETNDTRSDDKPKDNAKSDQAEKKKEKGGS
jgi:hypothetical protein